MLQDRLEDYIDVDVGKAEKVDPTLIVNEKLDYLLIGDLIRNEIPSLEIQNWLLKYKEITRKNNLVIKALSYFYIAPYDFDKEQFWIEILQENINTEV
ncbi:MAG: hypothetical protein ACFFDN_24485, partial [Candidatus Hodarchaeota archaeon]